MNMLVYLHGQMHAAQSSSRVDGQNGAAPGMRPDRDRATLATRVRTARSANVGQVCHGRWWRGKVDFMNAVECRTYPCTRCPRRQDSDFAKFSDADFAKLAAADGASRGWCPNDRRQYRV
jgi:hypothetical protein